MNDISFVHGVMKICPWCYEDMSLVLPGLNGILPSADVTFVIYGVTSCKLFHKKDK
jgi:hypothetical protein